MKDPYILSCLALPAILLLAAGHLTAAEQVDAWSLQPGGRSATGELELTGHLGSPAALGFSDSLTLASGYTGQISNQAPRLVDPGLQHTLPGTAKQIDAQGADADGDRLVYQILEAPAHGSLSGSGPTYTYAPDAGYRGSDDFLVRVHDGADRSRDMRVELLVGGTRTIHIAVHPAPADLVEMEAAELSGGFVRRAAYDPDAGATLDLLLPGIDHLLIPILGGEG